MQKKASSIIYSPSDLITFMADPFSSWMDRRYLENPEGLNPDEVDENAVLIQKHGIKHEIEFLQELKNSGADLCSIEARHEEGLEQTINAMKAGREIIYQGYLLKEPFAGLSDFLVRRAGKSALGDFHYEVWDSKLAKKPKPYFLVQLCCYAEMIAEIQGLRPDSVAIVLGSKEKMKFRTEDYYYYYRSLKERFLAFQNKFNPDKAPIWINVGEHSRWSSYAEKSLEEQDSLVRVAGIRNSQIKRLHESGIMTMNALAKCENESLRGISQSSFQTLKAQARLQIESKSQEKPLFEVLKQDSPRRGLGLLPPASKLDVYFDMEGYPHIEGGLEYLFGAVRKEKENFHFDDWWAHNREEEKNAFESFLKWIYEKWLADPQMHVYHYGAYEVSAMRRLASRHACKEWELDQLLKAQVFVDLYAIVKQGLRIGADSYSIKKVEGLYMEKREGEVAKATDSIVYYERWLEESDGPDWQSSKTLSEIRDYNRIDCESTAKLCFWLRSIQEEYGINYCPPPLKEEIQIAVPVTANEILAEQLRQSIPKDQSSSPELWRLTNLFADLLGFHRRESKVSWWEFFDRADLSDDELEANPDCIAFASRSNRAPEKLKRSLLYEYYFDSSQDLKLKVGDNVVFSSDTTIDAQISSLNHEKGILVLKRGEKREAPPDNGHLILKELMNYDALEAAIYEQAHSFKSNNGISSCLRDLLLRSYPRLKGTPVGEPLIAAGKDEIQGAVEAIHRLDNSYLCIQGPPGAGKTYLASKAVLHLVREGKRIGLSSNSHKAIENLLHAIGKLAEEEGMQISAVKIGQDQSGESAAFPSAGIRLQKDLKKDDDLSGIQILGGTAWIFSRPELNDKFDYLFVDEAGQVCLANIVAMASSTKNLVLIGDQLQLDQPIKGSHPGESGESSLSYLLGDSATIAPERGVFLSNTRRMHPNLCSLVSSAVYDGRLHADPVCSTRELVIPAEAKLLSRSNGVLYIPVEHQGNAQSSREELAVIAELIKELLSSKIKADGKEREFRASDVLLVAPYNKQVRLLQSKLPQIQSGSVDKFQGREAPVVIVSMCASDLASSPRGMEFLLSKKRLNVALSRAQLLAVVIGNPGLSQFACSTVEQAALLNFYCRIMQDGAGMKATCEMLSPAS
ncbi:MAG: TM0106 family RecB-like putative nuclease [Candidatus Obscuribacterales bacterium]|nr:TM0106 family RecB-like putative nuclease [Candidatus Obscuribacterales bacterium]